ncbi:MAG: outer membrane beta-barrel protein [Panacagrimonas sp.]
MMKSRLVAATLAGAFTLPALAAPTNNFADGYLVPASEIDVGPVDDDGDGFGIKGGFRITDQILLSGEYQSVDYDDSDAEIDQLRLGADFGPGAGAIGKGLYGRAQYVSFDGGDDDQNGVGGHVGYGLPLSEELRLHAEGGYLLLDDLDGPEFLVGASYRFAQNIGAFADYRMSLLDVDGGGDLDVSELRVGARFYF